MQALLNHTLDHEVYFSDNYVVLDFEIDTSHGDFGNPIWPDNKMLLASYSKGPTGEPRSVWGGEYEMGEVVEAVRDADFTVAHNAKYELGWLARCGLDLSKVLVFDTQLAEYVLLGNLRAGDERMGPRMVSLEACCIRRGWQPKDPYINIAMSAGINPVAMPRPWLQGRCESDIGSTHKLFLDQREKLDKTRRLGVVLTRCITSPVLADVERNGMQLDEARVEKEFNEYTAKMVKLSAEMDELTGGINWRSPPQVAEFIYDVLGFAEKTKRDPGTGMMVPDRNKASKKQPDGARKTDKDTLAGLKATTKEQKRFVKLRGELGKVNAALTKNLQFFQGICKEYGGHMYAQFNQSVTATHRLSSSGLDTFFEMFDEPDTAKKVQFQNLPRVFKPVFKASREGWLVGEWDGSQLEFRAGVELSADPKGIDDLLSGHDVHKFTGVWLFHAPKAWLKDIASHIDDATSLMHLVTKEQRQDSKAHTFKPTYGGSSGTPREKAYYEAFKARYSGMNSMQQQWVYDVLNSEHKCLKTPWGMRYYWPYAKMRGGYCNAQRAIFNYPIQAFATAEIIPIAMTYFWHRLAERGLSDYIKLVNTVHDSVICEIHPDYVDEFEQLAVDVWFDVYRYLDRVYGFRFQHVPLGTEVVIGTHWSEPNVRKQAYNIYADGRVEKTE